MLKRWVYIVIGFVSLCLGILGIFLPGLPTTIFLIITSYFWIRSSPALHSRLLNHKILGGYLKQIQNGMSRRLKIRAISTMWTMILISAFFFIESWLWRGVLFVVGIIGTISMGMQPEPEE
ncbi:MAG TPA: YbaN family protein [Bacteroidales bacterium]|nr:YbaN family protein [Bacteroidales bacterium]